MSDALSAPRLLAQAVAYAAFMAVVGYLSSAPRYSPISEDMALVRLSFSHAGARKGGCRRLSPEEIAALPANMRKPMDCPRARVPLLVELYVDGTLLYRESVRPSGLASDGPSTVYERFRIPAGQHTIRAQLRDSERDKGFDYERETSVVLQPRESFVVDFRAETGGFRFF
ncbi:MAG: hypothetical protein ACR2RB_22725 [Gammaproteobacteria bacterium]